MLGAGAAFDCGPRLSEDIVIIYQFSNPYPFDGLL